MIPPVVELAVLIVLTLLFVGLFVWQVIVAATTDKKVSGGIWATVNLLLAWFCGGACLEYVNA